MDGKQDANEGDICDEEPMSAVVLLEGDGPGMFEVPETLLAEEDERNDTAEDDLMRQTPLIKDTDKWTTASQTRVWTHSWVTRGQACRPPPR